jgi:hypothetical protein
MIVLMELKDLTRLLKIAVLEGADKAFDQGGGFPASYTKAEAYRLYGRSDVDRWIAEGLITPATSCGRSSKKSIDRVKLQRIAAASNRITYLPVAER